MTMRGDGGYMGPFSYLPYFLELIALTNNSKTNWYGNLTIEGRGDYNITFVYNETPAYQNRTVTHFFSIINNEHKRIEKEIRSVGIDTYNVTTKVENLLNYSEDLNAFSFIDSSMSIGAPTPPFSFSNTTFGEYDGFVRGWNLTVTGLSTNYLRFPIGSGGPDYDLIKSFAVGLE